MKAFPAFCTNIRNHVSVSEWVGVIFMAHSLEHRLHFHSTTKVFYSDTNEKLKRHSSPDIHPVHNKVNMDSLFSPLHISSMAAKCNWKMCILSTDFITAFEAETSVHLTGCSLGMCSLHNKIMGPCLWVSRDFCVSRSDWTTSGMDGSWMDGCPRERCISPYDFPKQLVLT